MPRPMLLALPAAVLISILLPASAGAVGWVTGPPLSPPGRIAVEPVVGVTPSGERIVAWKQERVQDGNTVAEGISVRIAPPGGDFGPVQSLGGPAADDFSLITGTDDNAALVWVARDDSLHIARRAPGSVTFVEAAPFPLGQDPDAPDAVAIQGGDVYVALATRQRANPNVNSAVRAFRLVNGATAIEAVPGSGAGGAVDTATFNDDTQPDHFVASPRIAFSAGVLHVAWEDRLDVGGNVGARTTVRRASRPANGGAIGAAVFVDSWTANSFRADQSTPQVTAAAGRTAISWTRGSQRDVSTVDLAGPAGIQRVRTTGFPFGLRAGVDAAGIPVLSWEETGASDFAFLVNSIAVAPDRAPGLPERITRPNTSQVLDDVASGADGGVLIVANRRTDQPSGSVDGHVVASLRPSGGVFGTLEDVSGPHERARESAFDKSSAALARDGRAFVVWAADDLSGTHSTRLLLSERDAAPPSIASVTIPLEATAEVPVTLAAAATDELSSVAVAWDFGDGSGGRGAVADHTYGAPGNYSVTVTARDGAGNVARDTRTINVRAVPVQGAGPGPAAAPDRTPPAVTQLKAGNRRFRVGSRSTQLISAGARRAPSGTDFSLTLNERATVVLSFTGKVPGRRAAGSKCTASRRTGRRCTIAVEPGTLIRAARGPGKVSLPFSGRVGSARLAPGSYRLAVTAIDAAGNRSRPKTVSFAVVSR